MKIILPSITILAVLGLNACTESGQNIPQPTVSAENTGETPIKLTNTPAPKTTRKVVTVKIQSLDELMQLFEEHNYTRESWLAGNREVPRITFAGVPDTWKNTSNNIPVQQKKAVFFRLMGPLILLSNEMISAERNMIERQPLNSTALINIAKKYKIADANTTKITPQERIALLNRVDIIPPSLALAQAAEESGWGTSRFSAEGNAFFGQWDFSGNGMIPKQQRSELGNYGIARFDSPLDSVQAYMLNINTHDAYKHLRARRAELRSDMNNNVIDGSELAKTLLNYSERGQAYIDGLLEMIRYNHLDETDNTYLSNTVRLNLVDSES